MELTEKLVEKDDATRRLSLLLSQGSQGLESHKATITVHPRGQRATGERGPTRPRARQSERLPWAAPAGQGTHGARRLTARAKSRRQLRAASLISWADRPADPRMPTALTDERPRHGQHFDRRAQVDRLGGGGVGRPRSGREHGHKGAPGDQPFATQHGNQTGHFAIVSACGNSSPCDGPIFSG